MIGMYWLLTGATSLPSTKVSSRFMRAPEWPEVSGNAKRSDGEMPSDLPGVADGT